LELLVVPRQASLNLVEVGIFTIRQENLADQATVFVHAGAIEAHVLARNEAAQMLLRRISEGLAVLRRINTFEAYIHLLAAVSENCDGVAVLDRKYFRRIQIVRESEPSGDSD
jgi:hypothetical protein